MNENELRQLHLLGATGVPRIETHDGREHLVVPVVALIGDNVIHAVNAPTAEFVPASLLSAQGWDGRPLMLGHPMKDGKQISANAPHVVERQGFGFLAGTRVDGRRLRTEAWVDVARLEKLGQQKLLGDLRAGKSCEVSVGAFVHTRDKNGVHAGKRYAGEWTSIGSDHLAFLPGGRGACSVEMGCGANRAAAMRVMEGSDELQDAPKGKTKMRLSELKAKMLALFDTPEQSASEEAAELIAYRSMRVMMDAVKDQWDEASDLVDALISDEEENPTTTTSQEDAEEEVEDARLDAIRMLCNSMSSALNNVCSVTYSQQRPEPMSISDPRYAESRVLIGKAISAKNMKVIQAAHDSAHGAHDHAVALGAECAGMKAMAGKDCPMCSGTGQTKDGKKQQDCAACDGTGKAPIKAAELKAACSCEEAEMDKKSRIAALLGQEPVKAWATEKALEALDETQLKALEDQTAKTAADAKAALDAKAGADAKIKAAAEHVPTEEEYLKTAPESIRTLVAEKKASDAAEKVGLVTKLVAASKALTKEQLEARSLEDLRTLALFAKVETPDYSIKGVPVPRAAAAVEDYTPPNPYEKGLKALQEKVN